MLDLFSLHILPGLFPRLLGGVYLLAFASLLVQVQGLYGSRGILPIRAYLAGLRRGWGHKAFALCPSVFWLNSSDRMLTGCALAGMILALLLIAGSPALPLLVLLWLLYLSFAATGQVFLAYQWDALLLETGFMTIFLPLAAPSSPMVAFAYHFFLFRFIFSAGVVKLRSGDPVWRNLAALCYHYETQPLPNRLGWYAHQLPATWQKLSTAGAFFFELAVPFLALGPVPARLACFVLLLFFQGLIFATGNYGFFNVLSMVLLVPLLAGPPFPLFSGFAPAAVPVGEGSGAALIDLVFALFVILNTCQLIRLFSRPAWLSRLLAGLSPFMISNAYGLFAVMTTDRFEFVIEGSRDQTHWNAYEFRWKPGDPRQPPRQAAPHQPRLDWQMWFAALDPGRVEPWLATLLVRLLEGSPPVLALLGHNPFADAPPRQVRLLVYRYRFTTPTLRRKEGRWWGRTLIGEYPPMVLKEGSGQRASLYREPFCETKGRP